MNEVTVELRKINLKLSGKFIIRPEKVVSSVPFIDAPFSSPRSISLYI
ncbi:MAG: hypothetical protein ACE3JK_02770 [Sporolactobacillus sp.]